MRTQLGLVKKPGDQQQQEAPTSPRLQEQREGLM